MNRRQFLTTTALAATILNAESCGKQRNPYCVFSKPLQMLSYDDLADLIAELGFDGIEGTIRPGGQITPEQVPVELPKMMEAPPGSPDQSTGTAPSVLSRARRTPEGRRQHVTCDSAQR